jgi:plasmid stabilization system protein ParE
MRSFRIVYSVDAENDFEDLYQCIAIDYSVPITAFRYLAGLKKAIKSLEINPYIYAIRTNHLLLQYGFEVRRLNHKKMTIIYTIHDDMVYIHRIIASSLITDL